MSWIQWVWKKWIKKESKKWGGDEHWLKGWMEAGRSRKSSKRPTERGFTNSEGHSLTLPSLPSPLFNKTSTCSNQYTPTHWDTMHTYRCARLGPTLHSAPSLAWMPEEKCGKMCHLSIHSSALTLFTPPSQPFAFHYEKKSIFQFRITCAEISHTLLPIILTETLMRRGFRLFHWPIYKPWLQYDLFYPPTHMEVRWKADCNFCSTNIFGR